MSPKDIILINQSGRGDKDIFTIADALGDCPMERLHSEESGGIPCLNPTSATGCGTETSFS